MRQQVLEYIQNLNLGSFVVSNELPWNESGVALFTKNLKKVYVDNDQYSVEPLVQALNGLNIHNQINTVRVFFANDAKQLPADYEQVIEEMQAIRNVDFAQGHNRREVDISTEIEADRMITTVELRFIKLT
jgi:biopolymer transport protein ExbD